MSGPGSMMLFILLVSFGPGLVVAVPIVAAVLAPPGYRVVELAVLCVWGGAALGRGTARRSSRYLVTLLGCLTLALLAICLYQYIRFG